MGRSSGLGAALLTSETSGREICSSLLSTDLLAGEKSYLLSRSRPLYRQSMPVCLGGLKWAGTVGSFLPHLLFPWHLPGAWLLALSLGPANLSEGPVPLGVGVGGRTGQGRVTGSGPRPGFHKPEEASLEGQTHWASPS